ncbi:hypothetical protein C5B42_05610 [Candidatus Cerribacteria bacterium 'Amazon FNV 2010 28 9']|uniref:ABC transporter permease n=1 Tax=Candidatus Cerribacteria bacterium 'Amazon FNV 2010 28 9' TaxID=2081795 RepID=A0A317JS22_9BACT|nr:MAG: hypothetical protein C5B42_05610 [Candidatus Cerribacteria bacterium 'Amazon FNV 2010 28 9']
MKRYLSLYWTLIKLNWKALREFPADSVTSIFSGLIWGVFMIVSLQLLFWQIPSVAGWTREGVVVLGAVYSVVVGLFRAILSRNMDDMAKVIHMGELDVVLSKPIDTQFLLSTRLINISGLVRVVVATIFIVWFLPHIGIHPTVIDLLLFGALCLLSLLFLYGLYMSITALLVWYSHTNNLVDIAESLLGTSRYPQGILQRAPFIIASIFVPFFLIINVPSKALLHRMTEADVVSLALVSVGTFLFSRFFWRYALRFYTGAGG